MSTLPTLEAIRKSSSDPSSSLGTVLAVLFEPSSILLDTLEPQLSVHLKSQVVPPSSYAQLIDLALAEITKWDTTAQSKFISGHPRIGENKNLSILSAKEQGTSGTSSIPPKPTPPEVIARLKHLNACYEAQYPGLRYITFVNGRSRAMIAEEMEGVLGIEHSLSPDEPSLDTFGVRAYNQGDEQWLSELRRAVVDVGKIAKSRLNLLGVN